MTDLVCAGCKRVLEIGDQYIEGTAGDYLHQDVDSDVSDLLAEVFGGRDDGKIIYCEDCTELGGDFKFNTYYGDVS